MIIVIDAYNLLRAVPPYKKTITDKERVQFIARLGAYGRKKGHKMVIVFDGGPYEWPQKESHKTVLIMYSGINLKADDCIKEYMDQHREQDVLLVSSDSELNRYAAQRSIASIDSVAFAQLVKQAFSDTDTLRLVHDDSVTKLAQGGNPDIDELMRQASKKVPVKSEDVVQKNHVSKKLQPAKEERRLLKKLGKL